MKIALLGDHDETVTAHRAIPKAIDLAANFLSVKVELDWIRSNEVQLADLQNFDALWCVPLSPYENPDAIIAAIGYARENNVAFLGTCVGYQHALLEFARNVLGFEQADSIEDNPDTAMPLITALSCRLAGEADTINIEANSRMGEIYQTDRVLEDYNCGYGINRDYLQLFEGCELKFCGHDGSGEPRACEIPGHRFFVGTAYQPERSAFNNKPHPLITAFLVAAL